MRAGTAHQQVRLGRAGAESCWPRNGQHGGQEAGTCPAQAGTRICQPFSCAPSPAGQHCHRILQLLRCVVHAAAHESTQVGCRPPAKVQSGAAGGFAGCAPQRTVKLGITQQVRYTQQSIPARQGAHPFCTTKGCCISCSAVGRAQGSRRMHCNVRLGGGSTSCRQTRTRLWDARTSQPPAQQRLPSFPGPQSPAAAQPHRSMPTCATKSRSSGDSCPSPSGSSGHSSSISCWQASQGQGLRTRVGLLSCPSHKSGPPQRQACQPTKHQQASQSNSNRSLPKLNLTPCGSTHLDHQLDGAA